MKKIRCTVGILTHNNEKTLERALASVKEFAEIIVCDGGSTDDTLDIAKKYGARILIQDRRFLDENGRLTNFAGARNQCLDAAIHEWFFFLDSDEWCGNDLIAAIDQTIQAGKPGAFFVNRKYVRHGVVIDCATTYPNRQMRFFARATTERFVKKVHERIQVKEGVVPHTISGFMYVPIDDTLAAMRRKWDHYIAIEVARRSPVTWKKIGFAIYRGSKISMLYLYRLLRYWLFCRGVRMPFLFEMERHRYHAQIVLALLRAKLHSDGQKR